MAQSRRIGLSLASAGFGRAHKMIKATALFAFGAGCIMRTSYRGSYQEANFRRNKAASTSAIILPASGPSTCSRAMP